MRHAVLWKDHYARHESCRMSTQLGRGSELNTGHAISLLSTCICCHYYCEYGTACAINVEATTMEIIKHADLRYLEVNSSQPLSMVNNHML
jgi:hypothetical protein